MIQDRCANLQSLKHHIFSCLTSPLKHASVYTVRAKPQIWLVVPASEIKKHKPLGLNSGYLSLQRCAYAHALCKPGSSCSRGELSQSTYFTAPLHSHSRHLLYYWRHTCVCFGDSILSKLCALSKQAIWLFRSFLKKTGPEERFFWGDFYFSFSNEAFGGDVDKPLRTPR